MSWEMLISRSPASYGVRTTGIQRQELPSCRRTWDVACRRTRSRRLNRALLAPRKHTNCVLARKGTDRQAGRLFAALAALLRLLRRALLLEGFRRGGLRCLFRVLAFGHGGCSVGVVCLIIWFAHGVWHGNGVRGWTDGVRGLGRGRVGVSGPRGLAREGTRV